MAYAVVTPPAARPARATLWRRRWAVAAGALTLTTAVARTAAPAAGAPDAQAVGGRSETLTHIHLPRLDRHPDPPPPAPGAFLPVLCSTSGDIRLPPGWRVACGGMGRVRDLVVVRSEAGGGGSATAAPFAAVLAVGDGAALGVPDGGSISWRVATGVDLSGLNHATISRDLSGWAVGDARRIARLAYAGDDLSPSWSIDAYGWPTETFQSLELKPGGIPPIGDPWPPNIGGWAVGSAVTGTRTVALIAQLDISQPAPLWRHLAADTDGLLLLPPLFDVQSVPAEAGGQQLWAIGQDGATGVLAQMQLIEEQWTWRRDASIALDGYPTELVLRSDKLGWAFGRSAHTQPTAALWRLENGRWQQRPRILHPGQQLIDAYVVDLATITYGLTPSAEAAPFARDAIRRAVDGGDWATVARWPAAEPIPPADGHRALAPLGAERYLYALGDSLWLVDAAAGSADAAGGGGGTGAAGAAVDGEWTRLWQRHDLQDVAGGPEHGWALADVTAPDGPHLLAIGRAGLRRWQPDGPLPRLRALAKGGTTYWAVGDGGATWWLPEGRSTWQPAPADRTTGGGDLLAVAATPGGALWAAGVDPAGGGRVWRMGAGRWRAIQAPAAPVALTAIAATDKGNAWATGSGPAPIGALLFIRQASAGPRACPPDVEIVGPWFRTDDLCVLTTKDRGVAVTSTGDDILWLARSGDIVETGLTTFKHHSDLGLPHGCRLTAISAAHPNAVWAAAVCAAAPDDASRGATRLLRWDGTAWHQATVINTPIRRLVAGTVTGGDDVGAPWVWAVGDWTTFLQYAAP